MKDTYIPSIASTKSKWYVIDANEKCLGRLATEVVKLLRGKNKTFYTPAQDIGDYIVIINAEKVLISGKKSTQKIYMRHSGRPGGKTLETFIELQSRLPERIIEKAVKGMLPKNRLGRQLFTKLKIYSGTRHPHTAQNPKCINL
jgi:large subunit ribosomal protein L13